MSNRQYIAIDDGSSQIKLMVDGEVTIVKSTVVNEARGDSENFSDSAYYVGGHLFTVLDRAEQPLPTNFDQFQYSDLNRVLVNEALRLAGLGGREIVVGVTLPIDQFFKKGRGSIPNKEIIEQKKESLLKPVDNLGGCGLAKIVEVHVFPEAIPAAVDVMTNINNGSLKMKDQYKEGFDQICCIDVGGYTVDISVFDPYTSIISKKDSFNGGVIEVVEDLQGALASLSMTNTNVRQYIAHQALLARKFRGQDIGHIIDEIAASLRSRVKSYLQKLADESMTELFILVGGGAPLVEQAVIDYAGVEKTVVPQNSDLSILRGINKMLQLKAN